jgi:hypothetical protein
LGPGGNAYAKEQKHRRKDLNSPAGPQAHARGRLVWDMKAPYTRGKNMHTLTAKNRFQRKTRLYGR